MTEQNMFYYPYASFTNQQLPLLKVAAVWFDKFVILDPVGASWDAIGADHVARDALWLLKDEGITVGTAAAVLAFFPTPATPVALAVAGLGLVCGTAIFGAECLLD